MLKKKKRILLISFQVDETLLILGKLNVINATIADNGLDRQLRIYLVSKKKVLYREGGRKRERERALRVSVEVQFRNSFHTYGFSLTFGHFRREWWSASAWPLTCCFIACSEDLQRRKKCGEKLKSSLP